MKINYDSNIHVQFPDEIINYEEQFTRANTRSQSNVHPPLYKSIVYE